MTLIYPQVLSPYYSSILQNHPGITWHSHPLNPPNLPTQTKELEPELEPQMNDE